MSERDAAVKMLQAAVDSLQAERLRGVAAESKLLNIMETQIEILEPWFPDIAQKLTIRLTNRQRRS